MLRAHVEMERMRLYLHLWVICMSAAAGGGFFFDTETIQLTFV